MAASLKNSLGTFLLKSIIVHEVPRQNGFNPVSPRLSTKASPLGAQVKSFFEDRIIDVLKSRGFDAEVSPSRTSKVPDHIDDYFKGNITFVKCSQELATQLVNVQAGRTSPGVLCVAECHVGGKPAIALVKLEKEGGAQIVEEQENGELILNINYVQELMLTDKTRVFKAGLFVRKGKTLATTLALASDPQQPRTSVHGVARFFLQSFLGCQLATQPDVATKMFFEAAVGYIKGNIPDPADLADCLTALRTTLTSNANEIDPVLFARNHLPKEHRAPFQKALASASIAPGLLAKDTSLITANLKHLLVELDSGIKITVPPQANDYLAMEEQTDGTTEIRITDSIKSMK